MARKRLLPPPHKPSDFVSVSGTQKEKKKKSKKVRPLFNPFFGLSSLTGGSDYSRAAEFFFSLSFPCMNFFFCVCFFSSSPQGFFLSSPARDWWWGDHVHVPTLCSQYTTATCSLCCFFVGPKRNKLFIRWVFVEYCTLLAKAWHSIFKSKKVSGNIRMRLRYVCPCMWSPRLWIPARTIRYRPCHAQQGIPEGSPSSLSLY